jgi:hypothetical protein
MKRLAIYLAGLYPQRWRKRYGREFEALLEEANLTWSDLCDIVVGALRMRFKTWNTSNTPEGANHTMDHPETLLRLIELKDRDIPHGYELETTIEQTRSDGSKAIVRQFFRELDFGDSYVTVHHLSRDAEAAQTFIVSGRKGEVAGDFRTDTTEMLTLRADGTVHRSAQTVKTWIQHEAIRERLRETYRNGLKAGLSPDEVYQKLLGGPRTDRSAIR